MEVFWATTKAVATRRISTAPMNEIDRSLDFNIVGVSPGQLGRINGVCARVKEEAYCQLLQVLKNGRFQAKVGTQQR
jgi:hypothetical protein